MKVYVVVALSAFALATACGGAEARLALSANDGKETLLGDIPKSHTPDNVAVIDLNHFPPKVIGTVDVPTSMIGPPVAIAGALPWYLMR
jgi:hypothetical protein